MSYAKKLSSAIFFILFVVWVLAIVPIALFSILFKRISYPSPDGLVDDSHTICGLLLEKGLLSQADYDFEHFVVSKHYNYDVFIGYQFLVSPVLFLLRFTNWIDEICKFFVGRWMATQQHSIQGLPVEAELDQSLSQLALFYAGHMGNVLLNLGFGMQKKETIN
ncbi:MAG: hypothetical protein AB8E15_00865 [Bdellovibrionales bacterium]